MSECNKSTIENFDVKETKGNDSAFDLRYSENAIIRNGSIYQSNALSGFVGIYGGIGQEIANVYIDLKGSPTYGIFSAQSTTSIATTIKNSTIITPSGVPSIRNYGGSEGSIYLNNIVTEPISNVASNDNIGTVTTSDMNVTYGNTTTLAVLGKLKDKDGQTGTNGQILTSDTNGNVDWQTPTAGGDITAVNVTGYLNGGGTSGDVTIGVDTTGTIGLATKYDIAGLSGGGGDITEVNVSPYLTGGGTTGSVTIGIDTTSSASVATKYYVFQNDKIYDPDTLSIIGSILSISGGNSVTLPSTSTDLTSSGTSSAVNINSSTGTDITINAGTGISYSGVTSTGFTINTPWTISSNNIYKNNSGNVGINETSPAYPLIVKSPTGSEVGTNIAYIGEHNASSEGLYVRIPSTANGGKYSVGIQGGLRMLNGSNTAAMITMPDGTVGTAGQVLKSGGDGSAVYWGNDATGVTSVTGTSPITSSGGNTPAIGISLNSTTMQNSSGLNAKKDTAIWNADRLQGSGISTTAPTTGQVLKYNGSSWIPDTDNTGSGVTNLSINGTSSPLTLISSTQTNSGVTITGGNGINLVGTSGNMTIQMPTGSSTGQYLRWQGTGSWGVSTYGYGMIRSGSTTIQTIPTETNFNTLTTLNGAVIKAGTEANADAPTYKITLNSGTYNVQYSCYLKHSASTTDITLRVSNMPLSAYCTNTVVPNEWTHFSKSTLVTFNSTTDIQLQANHTWTSGMSIDFNGCTLIAEKL